MKSIILALAVVALAGNAAHAAPASAALQAGPEESSNLHALEPRLFGKKKDKKGSCKPGLLKKLLPSPLPPACTPEAVTAYCEANPKNAKNDPACGDPTVCNDYLDDYGYILEERNDDCTGTNLLAWCAANKEKAKEEPECIKDKKKKAKVAAAKAKKIAELEDAKEDAPRDIDD